MEENKLASDNNSSNTACDAPFNSSNSIERIKIDNVDVFLEDMGGSKGKITISDTYNHNYSYFWGAMGGTLKDFICSINKEYFASKLLGSKNDCVIDVKKTFASVRKHIKEEIGLNWFNHMEFQAEMREILSDFQRDCYEEDSRYFVDNFFHSFINRLPFHLIDDRFDMKRIERDFKEISEQWYFIVEKPSNEHQWLEKFHTKLKRRLMLNRTPKPERSVATEAEQRKNPDNQITI